MIEPVRLKAMQKKAEACAEASPKPMAAHWYENDVPLLLEEIERLRSDLHRALWKAS